MADLDRWDLAAADALVCRRAGDAKSPGGVLYADRGLLVRVRQCGSLVVSGVRSVPNRITQDVVADGLLGQLAPAVVHGPSGLE
jgi:hypothetical protein